MHAAQVEQAHGGAQEGFQDRANVRRHADGHCQFILDCDPLKGLAGGEIRFAHALGILFDSELAAAPPYLSREDRVAMKARPEHASLCCRKDAVTLPPMVQQAPRMTCEPRTDRHFDELAVLASLFTAPDSQPQIHSPGAGAIV